MDQIRNIVAPIDYSVKSRAAIARAVTLARLDEASVHLVHAIRFPLTAATAYEISIPAALSEGVRALAKEKLVEARDAIPEAGVLQITVELSESIDPVRAIAAAVESKHADLVVMGTHGRNGLKHAFLGSVAERTLHTLDCPILAVKEDPGIAELPITRILVAVDFSIHSDMAVETATALAERLGAALDSHGIAQNLGDRSRTIGRTTRVANDP